MICHHLAMLPLLFFHELIGKCCLWLLQNRKSHIKIHEDAQGNICTVGLTARTVNSLQEVYFLHTYYNRHIINYNA